MPCTTPHTCPAINYVIRGIKDALSEAIEGAKITECELAQESLYQIKRHLENLPDLMEDLRTDNSSLRNYGEGKELEADELKYKIDQLTIELSNLDTINNERD